jgi:hypothetical protein
MGERKRRKSRMGMKLLLCFIHLNLIILPFISLFFLCFCVFLGGFLLSTTSSSSLPSVIFPFLSVWSGGNRGVTRDSGGSFGPQVLYPLFLLVVLRWTEDLSVGMLWVLVTHRPSEARVLDGERVGTYDWAWFGGIDISFSFCNMNLC